MRLVVCRACTGEFEIEGLDEDYPIGYCPSCGAELDEEDTEEDTDE